MSKAQFSGSEFGVTADNLMMVDKRRPGEVAVTYLDPYDGLSSTVFEDVSALKLPPSYVFNETLGVGFNFANIAGFAQGTDAPEFLEINARGSTAASPIMKEIKDIAIADVAAMYRGYYGHDANLALVTDEGVTTTVMTYYSPQMRALLNISPSRPGMDDPDSKGETPHL